jgi:hypothetical protein
MTYYTKQILGSDGQERTYVFCDLPNGGTKSFIADPANTDYAQFKKAISEETAQLQDAEGNLMTAQAAKDFIKELP